MKNKPNPKSHRKKGKIEIKVQINKIDNIKTIVKINETELVL